MARREPHPHPHPGPPAGKERTRGSFTLRPDDVARALASRPRCVGAKRGRCPRGLFVVHLLTWDDIERVLDNSPAGQEFLGVEAPGSALTPCWWAPPPRGRTR